MWNIAADLLSAPPLILGSESGDISACEKDDQGSIIRKVVQVDHLGSVFRKRERGDHWRAEGSEDLQLSNAHLVQQTISSLLSRRLRLLCRS